MLVRLCLLYCSLHPTLPVLATASGQRHFRVPSFFECDSDNDDDESDSDVKNIENSLRLWWLDSAV